MTARSRLLALDLSAQVAGHLAVAINTYRRNAAKAAISVPPELRELEILFANRVTEAQSGPHLDDMRAAVDAQVVTPQTLDYADAATWLGVSHSTVKRLVSADELFPVRIGTVKRLTIADLKDLLNQRRQDNQC